MKIIEKCTGEVIAELITNRSMTTEEALELAGYVYVNRDDREPGYYLNGDTNNICFDPGELEEVY